MNEHMQITAMAVAEAIAMEREACAKIADSYRCGVCGMDGKAASEIRARSRISGEHTAHTSGEENG